jgi:hypothetical protein
MSDSDCGCPPLRSFDAETVLGLSSPVCSDLSCAISRLYFVKSPSANLQYSGSDAGWKFSDHCPAQGTVLLRNAIFHAGEVFAVLSVSPSAFAKHRSLSAVFISRNVARLGARSFRYCSALQIVVFEADSHLREIGLAGFSWCECLRSIAIPSLVGVLGSDCFSCCDCLSSAIFEQPSRLATIGEEAFSWCPSLRRFLIPASVTVLDGSAFLSSGISSIEIEEGSVSFRILNGLLVDYEVRSLIWVIGSRESIVIRS